MRELLIQFNLIPGLGSRVHQGICDLFTSIEEFRSTPRSFIATEFGVERARVDEWFRAMQERPAADEVARAEALGAHVITHIDAGFPKPLYETVGWPIVLYSKGAYDPADEPAVAVVGSRRPTPYGLKTAERIGERLGECGVTVVSGMARGVDGAAHAGALDVGGRTIAVLGCGIDRCYPPTHEALAKRIAQHGAVMTEFPLGTEPAPFRFPQRNRIISGLSRAVVVVEAAARSGSLITARLGLEQGREVFAVPGPITSPLSRGAHRLLDDGARLLQDIDQVVEAIGSTPGPGVVRARAPLSVDEEEVFFTLGADPTPIDEIVAKTGLPAAQVASLLTTLELKDRVRDVGAGRVVALD